MAPSFGGSMQKPLSVAFNSTSTANGTNSTNTAETCETAEGIPQWIITMQWIIIILKTILLTTRILGFMHARRKQQETDNQASEMTDLEKAELLDSTSHTDEEGEKSIIEEKDDPFRD